MAFSNNINNELKKGKKIYFWDVGIRNSLIKNFTPLELRNDVGALWENFVIVELLKQNRYQNKHAEYYFWRTTQQQEIDLIEVHNQNIIAYEIKYNPKQKAKFSKTFINNHKPTETITINLDNFFEVIL
ncbi:MAG TPA: hypothetical protein DDZ41_07495 [Flavobacterium sp.]|nr:hypothetical protein [Flavobacterium sp.]